MLFLVTVFFGSSPERSGGLGEAPVPFEGNIPNHPLSHVLARRIGGQGNLAINGFQFLKHGITPILPGFDDLEPFELFGRGFDFCFEATCSEWLFSCSVFFCAHESRAQNLGSSRVRDNPSYKWVRISAF